MSKRIASLHAYDCLGDVAWSLLVREYADYEEGPSELVFTCAGVFPGTGEEDPREWLRDVLVAAIERI